MKASSRCTEPSTSRLKRAISGLALLFLCTWITPVLFGQQDVHGQLIPVANRKSAPTFELANADSTKTHISDYHGKVLLLNFWATECGGCVLEIPSIIKLQKQYQEKGFTSVGVSMDISYEGLKNADEAWGRVRPFIAKHHLNYPVVMGDERVSRVYALHTFPTTYLLDKSGRIAVAYVGVLIDKDTVSAKIKSLLAEQ